MKTTQVFEVLIARVQSGQPLWSEGDDNAQRFMRMAGFAACKFTGGEVTGRLPGGDVSYFVIYTSAQKDDTFELVRRSGGAYKEIDSGKVMGLTPLTAQADDARRVIDARGTYMRRWNLVCEPSTAVIANIQPSDSFEYRQEAVPVKAEEKIEVPRDLPPERPAPVKPVAVKPTLGVPEMIVKARKPTPPPVPVVQRPYDKPKWTAAALSLVAKRSY